MIKDGITRVVGMNAGKGAKGPKIRGRFPEPASYLCFASSRLGERPKVLSYLASKGTISRATMLTTLIMGFIAGPAVSL